jgi:hypothetical protein
MNNLVEQIKKEFSQFQETEYDEEIIENCLFGYNENDFLYACKMLFKNTKEKTLKRFKYKDNFIKYRNMNRENFPDWLNNLPQDDQYDLKENYKIIIGYCFKEWDQYNCNYPDILDLIQSFHKEGIPYWCISAYIQEKINLIDNIYYIKKHQLLEIMNKGNDFKEGCRQIFKRQKLFKESLKKDGINFIEAITR